jgi:hypothetical protein
LSTTFFDISSPPPPLVKITFPEQGNRIFFLNATT